MIEIIPTVTEEGQEYRMSDEDWYLGGRFEVEPKVCDLGHGNVVIHDPEFWGAVDEALEAGVMTRQQYYNKFPFYVGR